jgi:cation diffusion facilitator CzcD-associated flavoprotein CzcO
VKYLHRVAARCQIVDKIQLSTDMTERRYLDADGVWEAMLSHLVPGTGDLSDADRKALIATKGKQSVYIKQETVRAKIVVSCVGILVEPNAWPTSISGRDKFEGEIFHSARWREEVDFVGKDVVVLGSECSAAQVVPSLFKKSLEAKSVTQLMEPPPGLCLG